jgi:hypothetical protein
MHRSLHQLDRFARGCRFRLTRRVPIRLPYDVWSGIEATQVICRPFASRFGNVSQYELLVLCTVAKHTQARRLFEFGTFDGLTTWHLAANCAPQGRVFTLDLPLDHPARDNTGHDRAVGKIHGVTVGDKYLQSPQREQITQLYSDSLEFDASPYRDSMDFSFIDASHEYRHVVRDTENALQMVRKGGVILWHDYSRWWPGVQKCLDDLSRRLPVFRVGHTSLAALIVP